MTYNILVAESEYCNTVNIVKNIDCLDKSALLDIRQVYLSNVTRNNVEKERITPTQAQLFRTNISR